MSAIFVIGLLSAILARNSIDACCYETPTPAVHFNPDMNLGVHVYTDVNFTRNFSDPDDARKYVLRFFKSVFLRFQSAHENLKLHLVNITFLNDTKVENECFTLYDHHTTSLGKPVVLKYLKLDESLDKFTKCMKNSNSIAYSPGGAPLVYVLTGHDTMRTVGKEHKRWPGYSARGGVCKENNVAIGPEKPGTFLGILAAARLLARLLGSDYDVRRSGANANIPDCQQARKHIMSYYEDSPDSHTFSWCSKSEMEATLKSYACTKASGKKIDIGSDVHYPGKDLSRDNQCKRIHYKLYASSNGRCYVGECRQDTPILRN
ncbi:uncharacterized protein LOC135373806 isoform X2 [Ornithodoros turicata]|uniref:uncharacterized protein LOC135373806 isoform X2 n=1 Tax=Ornithodoros turicata TaxID=34597 RepID=UPI003138B28C